MVGNPPWETLQIEDKQFFSNIGRQDIADAKTAALRKKLIGTLADQDPALYQVYGAVQRQSDGTNHIVRSGRYPLTASGKINTYSVFAETMRTIISPTGTAGIITPTGLATDKSTAPFFSDTLSNRRLLAFYDFENEAKIFAGVHNQFRFAVTAMTGVKRIAERTRFAFYTRYLADVPGRRFELAPSEVNLLNPNTGTVPIFRTRTDADITLGIYRRCPILIRDYGSESNLWGLTFSQGLFNMASDSDLFYQASDLTDAEFNGWSYEKQNREYVPLYEAKMLSHFDHRYSTYQGATQAQLNKGTLPRLTDSQQNDPHFEPLARYWVDRTKVVESLRGKWNKDWFLGWRNITNTSNERTFVTTVMPKSAINHAFPLAFPADESYVFLLQGIWSSLAFDYVVRQKLSGTNMTYSVLYQLACPAPADFEANTAWKPEQSVAGWITPYLLELSYTSWRIRPYAQAMGDVGAPFRWNSERRALLRADLDAAFLHVYGLTRSESEHVLDSFPVVRKYEERDHGEYRTRRLVLEAYDRMATAITRGGKGWESLAEVPAGEGLRHAE